MLSLAASHVVAAPRRLSDSRAPPRF